MKGRKSTKTNVVPLTTGAKREDFSATAKAEARKLKPPGLDPDVSRVWDALAPIKCNALERAKLTPAMVPAFVLLCKACVRFERLEEAIGADAGGETYTVETRNGQQVKSRPEVAQRNEAWRQYLTMLREFGMTPMAERVLTTKPAQGQLPLSDEDFGQT